MPHARSSAWEVFRAFLVLGLTSFGGPVAHLGYFRDAFVRRRAWLDEERFAHLLGLCQLLPGPASSQLGFAIGLHRAGWRGGLAAFAGFTLPSAALMTALAFWTPQGALGAAIIHGLKLVAVVVVGQALVGMWRGLIPDAARRLMAVFVAAVVLAWPGAWVQWLAVLAVALASVWLRGEVSPPTTTPVRDTPRKGVWALLVYAVLLAISTIAIAHGPAWQRTVAALYQSGALVFGGGHVVLPLLKQTLVVPGLIDEAGFLAGYGAAQAVPGPMFSLAAYLGQRAAGWPGGVLGLCAIFLPGMLLVIGVLPWWHRLTTHPIWRHTIGGIHAGVVGLLLAAFWNPVLTGAVQAPSDVGVAVVAWLTAWRWRLPAWSSVCWCVAAALGLHVLQPGF